MGLMERVATLLRANVNDLIDRAEDPEKMLKQLLTDMENQLLQVKTQVAIAIADQHLLEKKAVEQKETADGWRRKAELAVCAIEATLDAWKSCTYAKRNLVEPPAGTSPVWWRANSLSKLCTEVNVAAVAGRS